MRYKVILEKGIEDIFGLNNNKNQNSNFTSNYTNASNNMKSGKNINSNMNSKNNVVIEVSENPMNDSSMMLNQI